MRLRALIAAFNQAVEQYAFARLEIAVAHPRVVAPPVVDRLGVRHVSGNFAALWRAALRQVREADAYAKTGASAVARRDKAFTKLVAAFAQIKAAAAGIESLRVAGARTARKRRS